MMISEQIMRACPVPVYYTELQACRLGRCPTYASLCSISVKAALAGLLARAETWLPGVVLWGFTTVVQPSTGTSAGLSQTLVEGRL